MVRQQGVVAVGRLDEDLALVQAAGLFFDFPDGGAPLVRLGRDVAPEGEGLPVQPRGHQGEHQRRGAYERDDGDAVPVAEGHERSAGVRDRRQSGFGQQADVLPVEQGQQRLHFFRGRVFIQDVEFQFVDMAAEPVPGQDPAGRAQLLDDEAAEPAGGLKDGARNYLCGIVLSEWRRDQEKLARVVGHFLFR